MAERCCICLLYTSVQQCAGGIAAVAQPHIHAIGLQAVAHPHKAFKLQPGKIPVSYTHLDVYKRQKQAFHGALEGEEIGLAAVAAHHENRPFLRQRCV